MNNNNIPGASTINFIEENRGKIFLAPDEPSFRIYKGNEGYHKVKAMKNIIQDTCMNTARKTYDSFRDALMAIKGPEFKININSELGEFNPPDFYFEATVNILDPEKYAKLKREYSEVLDKHIKKQSEYMKEYEKYIKDFGKALAKQCDASPFMNMFLADPDSIKEPEDITKESEEELEFIEVQQHYCCEYSISKHNYEESIRKLDDYFKKCADTYLQLLES